VTLRYRPVSVIPPARSELVFDRKGPRVRVSATSTARSGQLAALSGRMSSSAAPSRSFSVSRS